MERLPIYYALSESVTGWTRGAEARALARYVFDLPEHSVAVEIGAFLGSGTILMAGARKLRRSGIVHSVDPFDASGDDYSKTHYEDILKEARVSQLDQFHANLERAGLSRWAIGHAGTAEEVAKTWNQPIDLLFMDGDQSPEGSRTSYEAWEPWLKPGAIVAIHNSYTRDYEPTHDGHFRLRQRLEAAPGYEWLEQAGSINFFKVSGIASN